MADRKNMSVADIIAAARKADSDGGEQGEAEESAPTEQSQEESREAASQSEEKSAPAEKVAPPGSPDRPGVSDILAAARAEKAAGKKKEESKEKAPAKAAPKKPSSKPAAKPAAAKSSAGESKPTEPRDTASILAAARKGSKAGPMSKSEAAAKAKADPVPKEKPKVVVPPMPEKPAYAKPGAKAEKKEKSKTAVDEDRRSFLSIGFWMLTAFSALWGAAILKFMFPNVLREPPSKFKVGSPDAFPAGQVQTKYKAQYGVWVVNAEYNGEQQIYALKSVCTHLGCTPNWLEAEQKFKCPCHGSGFYKDGINFEGPAPRPLERYAIQIADDGQIEIDKSRTFQQEMGAWKDPSSYIPV